MKLIVNGAEREFAERLTIAGLLASMQVPQIGVAVARNDRVIKGAQHNSVWLEPGDRVEIIRAVAGG